MFALYIEKKQNILVCLSPGNVRIDYTNTLVTHQRGYLNVF